MTSSVHAKTPTSATPQEGSPHTLQTLLQSFLATVGTPLTSNDPSGLVPTPGSWMGLDQLQASSMGKYKPRTPTVRRSVSITTDHNKRTNITPPSNPDLSTKYPEGISGPVSLECLDKFLACGATVNAGLSIDFSTTVRLGITDASNKDGVRAVARSMQRTVNLLTTSYNERRHIAGGFGHLYRAQPPLRSVATGKLTGTISEMDPDAFWEIALQGPAFERGALGAPARGQSCALQGAFKSAAMLSNYGWQLLSGIVLYYRALFAQKSLENCVAVAVGTIVKCATYDALTVNLNGKSVVWAGKSVDSNYPNWLVAVRRGHQSVSYSGACDLDSWVLPMRDSDTTDWQAIVGDGCLAYTPVPLPDLAAFCDPGRMWANLLQFASARGITKQMQEMHSLFLVLRELGESTNMPLVTSLAPDQPLCEVFGLLFTPDDNASKGLTLACAPPSVDLLVKTTIAVDAFATNIADYILSSTNTGFLDATTAINSFYGTSRSSGSSHSSVVQAMTKCIGVGMLSALGLVDLWPTLPHLLRFVKRGADRFSSSFFMPGCYSGGVIANHRYGTKVNHHSRVFGGSGRETYFWRSVSDVSGSGASHHFDTAVPAAGVNCDTEWLNGLENGKVYVSTAVAITPTCALAHCQPPPADLVDVHNTIKFERMLETRMASDLVQHSSWSAKTRLGDGAHPGAYTRIVGSLPGEHDPGFDDPVVRPPAVGRVHQATDPAASSYPRHQHSTFSMHHGYQYTEPSSYTDDAARAAAAPTCWPPPPIHPEDQSVAGDDVSSTAQFEDEAPTPTGPLLHAPVVSTNIIVNFATVRVGPHLFTRESSPLCCPDVFPACKLTPCPRPPKGVQLMHLGVLGEGGSTGQLLRVNHMRVKDSGIVYLDGGWFAYIRIAPRPRAPPPPMSKTAISAACTSFEGDSKILFISAVPRPTEGPQIPTTTLSPDGVNIVVDLADSTSLEYALSRITCLIVGGDLHVSSLDVTRTVVYPLTDTDDDRHADTALAARLSPTVWSAT